MGEAMSDTVVTMHNVFVTGRGSPLITLHGPAEVTGSRFQGLAVPRALTRPRLRWLGDTWAEAQVAASLLRFLRETR